MCPLRSFFEALKVGAKMKVSGSLLLVLFIQSHSLMLMVLCHCVYNMSVCICGDYLMNGEKKIFISDHRFLFLVRYFLSEPFMDWLYSS